MADKDGKTEKATPKRAGEARKEGRIAKSAELVSWASIFIALTVIKSTVNKGAALLNRMMIQMGQLIAAPDQGKALSFMVHSISDGMMVVLPLALIFGGLGIAGHLAQVRFVLAWKSLKPSMKHLNPINGIKKLLSVQSLFQVGKQATRVAIMGFIAYKTLWTTVSGFASNGPYGIGEIIRITAAAVIAFIREVALAGVVIGLIDYFYQKKKMADGMKMAKHEVKQESKEQDVAPEVRSKIRQRQRQMSRNRMMSLIATADVIVVNPVHIAVALKYDPERGAPKVVAKGAGLLAEKIRERAEEHKVPMVQDIPLARTLHRVCELDDEIPTEVFEAVARVLAFVFSLRSRGTSSGMHRMPGTPDVSEADAAEAKAAAEAAVAAELAAELADANA